METAHIQVRRLTTSDAAIYRDIRLDGLRRNPEAFGSTFEAESTQTLSWFSTRLGGSETFGAFAGSELLGVATLVMATGQKERHKGYLRGMYVRSESRRAGVGRRLLEKVFEAADQRIELIQLTVVSSNEPALHLYRSIGFAEYGVEKRALKQDGQYFDQVLMAKQL
jgi:ribosomal protein S18 acetylase RimI-like enzyme